MAITGTNRGTGGNNTAATTINISPASNFTAGSTFILAIAYDNSGTQGADPYTNVTLPAGIGSGSSTIARLNDPGAADAGSVLRFIYRSNISSFNTSDTITINFNSSVTAKAWTLTEFTTDLQNYVVRNLSTNSVTSGNGTTQTVTVTSAALSYATNDLIFAGLGQEGNGTRTGDSDTTDGNWSTDQNTGFGTTTGGQEIITQYKVISGTQNQTFNPVATPLGDWNIIVLVFREFADPFDPFGMMGFFGI